MPWKGVSGFHRAIAPFLLDRQLRDRSLVRDAICTQQKRSPLVRKRLGAEYVEDFDETEAAVEQNEPATTPETALAC